jgi:O-antigen/teichoic acid export membrane protein
MLLRQTLLFLPAQALVPLSQMAAAFLWTFWLPHEPMGTYAIIWSVQELIYLAIMSWWSTYCLRYASAMSLDGGAEAFDRTEMAVQLGGALLQAMAALAAVWLFLPQGFTFEAVVATLSFTLTRNVATHFSTRARAQMESLPYTVNLCTGSVLGLVFGLIAVTYIAATPETLLFAYALAQALGLIVGMPFSSVRLRRPAIDPQIWRAAWAFGGPMMISSAMTWAGNHAIRFVVEYGAGRAAVGVMTVGWWMGLRLAAFVGLLVMGAAFNVAVERFRKEGRQAGLHQLARNSAMLLAILIPSVIGVWLIGQHLVHDLVDESYRDATASILPVAMMAGAARAFREHGSDPAFLLFERAQWPPFIGTLDAVATIAFCALGLSFGGIQGAAWGAALGAAAAALASIVLAGVTLGYRVDVGDLARIVAASAVMTAPLLFLPDVMSIWAVLGAAAGGLAIYAAALAALYPRPSLRLLRGGRDRLNRIRVR